MARRVLSWSYTRPGFVEARRIIWQEVRNADLPEDLDVIEWFRRDPAHKGDGEAVAFLTSRDVSRFHEARANIDGAAAHTVATVGLSNAERIGARRRADTDADIHVGTINIAVSIEQGLTDAAFIETLSIATAARTTAMIDHGLGLMSGRRRAPERIVSPSQRMSATRLTPVCTRRLARLSGARSMTQSRQAPKNG